MPEPHLGRNFRDTDDVAAYILDEFASENMGVAEVIPSTEIEAQLVEVVENANELDDDEWHELVVAVKDGVLDHDVIIA